MFVCRCEKCDDDDDDDDDVCVCVCGDSKYGFAMKIDKIVSLV